MQVTVGSKPSAIGLGYHLPTTHSENFPSFPAREIFLRRVHGALSASAPPGAGIAGELRALRSESDPEFFYLGHLSLAQSLEARENYAAALAVYEALGAQTEFPDIRDRAKRRADAILGRGPAGPRTEVLLRRFAREATDPASLVAMGAAGATYKAARAASLARCLAVPEAAWLTRGWGARAASGLFAFSLEAPVFTLTSRGLRRLYSDAEHQTPLAGDLASSFLVLGGLKLGGLAAEGVGQRLAGNALSVPGLRDPAQRALANAGLLGGILLGHRMEEWAGLRPRLDGATTLTDSLATFLQFKVAAPMTGALLGRRFRDFDAELALRNRALSASPALGLSPRTAEETGGPLLSQGTLAPAWHHSLSEGKRAGSAGDPPAREADSPLHAFPRLHRGLFPKTRRFLEASPQLSEMLATHREDLAKIEQSLGSRETPGAVPYIARRLAERLLGDKKPDFTLHDHPVAVLLAATLAGHYEELGDLIGHRIYRDLLAVYRILREGGDARFLRAEDVILQNLELDPYNPWFLHLGLQTTLELGELAKFKPSYFIDLRESMEKAPEKWRASIVTRTIEKKLTDKSRRSYLKAAKEASGTYAILLGSLEFLGHLLSLAIPSPGHLIKGIFYLQRLGQKVKDTPAFFEDLKRKVSFEIQLYYGDYLSAVPLAEEGSKLPVVYELLRRQMTGDWLEKEIRLEEIPQLHPMTVRQGEALEAMKAKLESAKILSLEGLPGSAKTSLAVQLAHELGQDPARLVFWYTFKEGKSPDLHRFFHHLSHFLETRNPAIERGLAARVQAEPGVADKAALLQRALTRNPTVLFLDNFHLVAETVHAPQLFAELLQGAWLDTKAVTISRRRIEWHQKIGTAVFRKEAMTLEEAEALFANLGLPEKLSPELMQSAYILTRGRPMALMLLGELLRSSEPRRAEDILAALAQKDNRASTLKYLFDQVYRSLQPSQQGLLQFLAVFRDTVPRSVLSFFAPGEETAAGRDLVSLQESFLVEEPQPGLYSVHEKYRKLAALLPFERIEFHRRAAEYYRAYAKSPSDYLEAAHHYFEAREFDRAVKMLSGRVDTLWQKGYGDRLEFLLPLLQNNTRLSPGDRVLVSLERGTLLVARREWRGALAVLGEALAIQKSRGETAVLPEIYEKMAQAHEGLGEAKKAEALLQKAAALRK